MLDIIIYTLGVVGIAIVILMAVMVFMDCTGK